MKTTCSKLSIIVRVKKSRENLNTTKLGVFDLVDLFEDAKVKVTLDLLINLEKRIEVIAILT